MDTMIATPSTQGPPERPERFVVALAPCMQRPGVWHTVRRYPTPNGASTAAAQLANRRLKPPPGRWEFRSQKDRETGEGILWAKYLGPEK